MSRPHPELHPTNIPAPPRPTKTNRTVWRGMRTAPIDREGNFLVERDVDGQTFIEEVFAFEGQMYPQREMNGVCWESRVLNATRWTTIPL